MFPRSPVILAFVIACSMLSAYALPADTVLPNGIHLFDLPAEPAESDVFEVTAGYRTGGRNELAAAIGAELSSSPAARALTLAAYSCGGQITFFNDIDRTGFKLRVPAWAKPAAMEHAAGYLREIPAGTQGLPAAIDPEKNFRQRIEAEIRLALLGESQTAADRAQLFKAEYGTDRMFAGMSGGVPESIGQNLASIPVRTSVPRQNEESSVLTAERSLRFVSNFETGAVVFAVPVPSVYYDAWYSMLLLDRLIRRVVPGKPVTLLPLGIERYYYRLELEVPAGQFPDQVQEILLQEIQRLSLSRARPEDIEGARRDAVDYLNSPAAREWFAIHGIAQRREEGLRSLQSFSADDVRTVARDALITNRVLASWAPRVRQTTIEVERLSSGPAARPSPTVSSVTADPRPVQLVSFPVHSHSTLPSGLSERLSSGVSVIASTIHGVFVAGGSLTRFEKEPDAETVRRFQLYGAQRILVLSPVASMDRARQLWSGFMGNAADTGATVLRGNVDAADLPALFVLKTILDRKLIESGMWGDVTLSLDASVGATILVTDFRVLEWIRRIASEKPSDSELAWAREAAVHHLDDVLPDLQALTWEREPQSLLTDAATVSAADIQNAAKRYF